MAKIYAKPVEGLILPMADGSIWPAEGAWVEQDRFVRRRLAAGDIVVTDPPAAQEPVDGRGRPAETAATPETATAEASTTTTKKRGS